VITNDNSDLEPTTDFYGPSLAFDFPGLEIGVAEYEQGPTGCTVFHFPGGALTAIDIRGGSVGTTGNFEWNHAICLAGGSLYGLEAASGAAAELFARRGYATGFERIALVSGAIIYDSGPRDPTVSHRV
jgi:L-aminopeptidase/D-esterase-like protein